MSSISPAVASARPPSTSPNHNINPGGLLVDGSASGLRAYTPPLSPVLAEIPTPSSPGSRPLNVKDALSFLEMLKVKFQDKPDVYNHFLDIMKDFKFQAIDTSGVIDRVSALFNGHNALIQGFNTFLPHGYRMDQHDRDLITITTPSGITTQTTGSGTKGRLLFNEVANQYVIKVKERFGLDSDTYKQFLEILHTYDQEQHSIEEVYQRVNVLFDEHRDLLGELQHFWPDNGAGGAGEDDAMDWVEDGSGSELAGMMTGTTAEGSQPVISSVTASGLHHDQIKLTLF
ncbi:Transcriptional regulatory protein sin3 [Ceratobasidium sp. 428]|nr:Transcriptional regulatory protein sin3 [Ceratobasidium sp. 428]